MSVGKDPISPLGCYLKVYMWWQLSASVNVKIVVQRTFLQDVVKEARCDCEKAYDMWLEKVQVWSPFICNVVRWCYLASYTSSYKLSQNAGNESLLDSSAQTIMDVFERHRRKCLLKSFLIPIPGSALVALLTNIFGKRLAQ
jgi:hypothetical protein